ncbi:MAG: hypothetical protein KIT73_08650 [Burkholderiales bacterium]|nr:hypothetical protein [Burkholderiales bacterium]
MNAVPRLALALSAVAMFAASIHVQAGEPRKNRGFGFYVEEEGVPSPYDNPRDTAPVDDLAELTRQLVKTAVHLSKYRPPEAMPMVTRIPRADLERRACGSSAARCGVSAVYESERGILMAEDLRPETNLFHRSILLHEIVHYLQDVSHELAAAVVCERWYQREQEAYALQNRYLATVVSTADRVAYSGARPTCEQTDPLAHRAQVIKAPDSRD